MSLLDGRDGIENRIYPIQFFGSGVIDIAGYQRHVVCFSCSLWGGSLLYFVVILIFSYFKMLKSFMMEGIGFIRLKMFFLLKFQCVFFHRWPLA